MSDASDVDDAPMAELAIQIKNSKHLKQVGVAVRRPRARRSCVKGQADESTKSDAAKMVGQAIARQLKAKGVSKVVFDRNGYLFHGRIKALAEGAREAGLEF